MTVDQAVAAISASEHLRPDFVRAMFLKNGNGLVSTLTALLINAGIFGRRHAAVPDKKLL